MNERFEQMMLEATKDMPQGYYVPGEYFQKFAELIVRECAGIACQHMELNEGTDYNVGGKIKQHFGVNNERTN